jgi:hypothetical protein
MGHPFDKANSAYRDIVVKLKQTANISVTVRGETGYY